MWEEPSALGAAMLMTSIVYKVRIEDSPATERTVCPASFTAAFVVTSFSYGIWQSWWRWMLSTGAATLMRHSS